MRVWVWVFVAGARACMHEMWVGERADELVRGRMAGKEVSSVEVVV